MSEQARDPKFYVVGGPVAPGRPCYVQRAADAELYRRLRDGEYCHVLAQRQTGKTSLAASTAGNLRATDVLAAVVDLTQTSEEDPSENAGRWYYSIAYRIVRDLRIKADVQAWWAERGGLTNLQRLREFFLEVVLAETEAPVVIFFDRVEATRDEPLAQDLFATIRACYDARATDNEFQRLTMAMFGSAAPGELVKNVQGSAFEISAAIPLPDFSPQELTGLLPGLGDALDDPEQLAQRVWAWTRGHPYLSQKVFRGLARRKDAELTAATVDELVQTQFLGPHTLSEEPHLSAIAERLLAPGKNRSARLNLYGRLRKGVEMMADKTSRAQRELLTAGLVTIGPRDELRVRNEIYAMVFSTRWVNQNLPYGIKSVAVAAAAIACVLLAPIWYTEYLPRPYVRALSAANQDYEVAADAYASLHRLPGYSRTADRLFEEFLTRAARQATTLSDITRVNNQLEQMLAVSDRADELLADFWERKAIAAAHSGDRDGALIALLEALRVPTEPRRRWAAELVGQDYRNLLGTIHTAADLKAIRIAEATGTLVTLDASNQAEVWSLGAEDRPQLVRQTAIVAEEQLELSDRKILQRTGTAPTLYLATSHPRPEQVEVTLTAPSGQLTRLKLSAASSPADGIYALPFAGYPQLAAMAAGELGGNWTLTLADSEPGIAGELLDWGVRFAGETFAVGPDALAQPIPEPRLTDNAVARLGPEGRLALAWPVSAQSRGAVLVWDLATDIMLTRIPRETAMRDAQFVLGGQRVVTVYPRRMLVWDMELGRLVGEIPLGTSSRLAFSENRRFVVVRSLDDADMLTLNAWDLQFMRPVGAPIAAENTGPVTIDSAGRYLAAGGRDPWIRVWSLSDGKLVREFEHSSPLRSLKFDPTGTWLASDDLSSTFRLWNVREGGAPLIERFGIGSWQADFAADGSAVLFGSSDRAYQLARLPDGSIAETGLRQASQGKARVGPVLLADRNVVLTTDQANTLKLWSVPVPQSAALGRASNYPGGARAVLSEDGLRIAVGTTLGDIYVIASNTPGGITLSAGEQAAGSRGEITALAFSPDNRMLAAASIDGRVNVWNLGAGKLRDAPIVHPDGGAHDLVFVDNGRQLISVSRREVQVTRLDDGHTLARLRIQANHPQLAYAEATGDLFIADDFNGVTMWNWRTEKSERIVPTQYKIRTVAVTPDGLQLITASDERDLTLWDVAERKPLSQSIQAAGKVDDLWVTANDDLIVQAGYWLQTIGIYPNGLAARHTRLLPQAPAAVRPGELPDTAFVLSGSAARPAVTEVRISEPAEVALEGDIDELRSIWRRRLSLMLDENGNTRPAAGRSNSAAATEPPDTARY